MFVITAQTTIDYDAATECLTLEDWATADSKGYDRAIQQEFEDDALTELGNLIAGSDRKGNAYVWKLVQRMNERLKLEIDRREAWVMRWIERN